MKSIILISLMFTLSLHQASPCYAMEEEWQESDSRLYITLCKSHGETYSDIASEIKISPEELRKFRNNERTNVSTKNLIWAKLQSPIQICNDFVEEILDYWPNLDNNDTSPIIRQQLFTLAHKIRYCNSNNGRFYGANPRNIAACIKDIMNREEDNILIPRRIGHAIQGEFDINTIGRLVDALKTFPSDDMQLFAASIVATLDLERIDPAELLLHLNRPQIMGFNSELWNKNNAKAMLNSIKDMGDRDGVTALQIADAVEDRLMGFTYLLDHIK